MAPYDQLLFMYIPDNTKLPSSSVKTETAMAL